MRYNGRTLFNRKEFRFQREFHMTESLFLVATAALTVLFFVVTNQKTVSWAPARVKRQDQHKRG